MYTHTRTHTQFRRLHIWLLFIILPLGQPCAILEDFSPFLEGGCYAKSISISWLKIVPPQLRNTYHFSMALVLLLVTSSETQALFVAVTSTPTQPVKKGRGRPRGSGVGRRPRGRGSAKKTMTAAEIAGAQAGMTAAYAAYGYNFTGTGDQQLFVGSPLLFSCSLMQSCVWSSSGRVVSEAVLVGAEIPGGGGGGGGGELYLKLLCCLQNEARLWWAVAQAISWGAPSHTQIKTVCKPLTTERRLEVEWNQGLSAEWLTGLCWWLSLGMLTFIADSSPVTSIADSLFSCGRWHSLISRFKHSLVFVFVVETVLFALVIVVVVLNFYFLFLLISFSDQAPWWLAVEVKGKHNNHPLLMSPEEFCPLTFRLRRRQTPILLCVCFGFALCVCVWRCTEA